MAMLPNPLAVLSNPIGALSDPIGTITGGSKPPAPQTGDIE